MEKELCETCGKNEVGEESECPYSDQILEKVELCNCCKECYQKCLNDI